MLIGPNLGLVIVIQVVNAKEEFHLSHGDHCILTGLLLSQGGLNRRDKSTRWVDQSEHSCPFPILCCGSW